MSLVQQYTYLGLPMTADLDLNVIVQDMRDMTANDYHVKSANPDTSTYTSRYTSPHGTKCFSTHTHIRVQYIRDSIIPLKPIQCVIDRGIKVSYALPLIYAKRQSMKSYIFAVVQCEWASY